MRAVAIAILVALFGGCSSAQIDSWNPPNGESKCDGNNPYKCADGHSCCFSYQPVCLGPDEDGYYCQPHDFNPDDPGNVLFGKSRRVRAARRVDE